MTETDFDKQPDRVVEALRALLDQLEDHDTANSPWLTSTDTPLAPGRISATDQLSWWFRPVTDADDPWERFFNPSSTPLPHTLLAHLAPPRERMGSDSDRRSGLTAGAVEAEPPGSRVSLQLLLAEPEEEMIQADADAVVTCLYDFVHALGRRDVNSALGCIADDFHTLEDDREVDKPTLGRQLRALLDPFIGWDLFVSLVDIPQPVLHPESILVHAELHLEAQHPETDERQSIHERRVAVFRQQRDRRWLITGLAPT